MKKIYVITLFPDVMEKIFSHSMLLKAREAKKVQLKVVDLRKYGLGPRKQVDDTPYGGGGGMLLKPEPIYKAVADTIKKMSSSRKRGSDSRLRGNDRPFVILLTPQGKQLTQETAEKLAKSKKNLILIAGHYEGFDERIRKLADMELSIGSYVLTGGEIPAAAVIDSIVRLIPGVLGAEKGTHEETFSKELKRGIEYPHYTRPEEFEGMRVPKVLLSGHHGDIKKWRREQSLKRTRQKHKGHPGM